MEPHKVSSILPKPSWLTQEDGCNSGFPAASSRLEPPPLTTPVKQGAKREVSWLYCPFFQLHSLCSTSWVLHAECLPSPSAVLSMLSFKTKDCFVYCTASQYCPPNERVIAIAWLSTILLHSTTKWPSFSHITGDTEQANKLGRSYHVPATPHGWLIVLSRTVIGDHLRHLTCVKSRWNLRSAKTEGILREN